MIHTKLSVLNFSLGLAFLLSSCDSSTPLSESIRTNDDKAESLESLAAGDRLQYNPASGQSIITQMTFDSSSVSSFGNGSTFYEYEKAGRFSFTVELKGATSSSERFQQIVDNLLGSNSSLATEFRSIIINRFIPNFTPEEIERLKIIMNPSGAELTGDTVDELFVTTNRKFTNFITSTEGDKILGTMGGVYTLQSNIVKVGFRPPTSSELAASRFLTPNSQIPFVSTFETPTETVENGTWVLEFSN